jgi:hypothetical protein
LDLGKALSLIRMIGLKLGAWRAQPYGSAVFRSATLCTFAT